MSNIYNLICPWFAGKWFVKKISYNPYVAVKRKSSCGNRQTCKGIRLLIYNY